MGHTILPQKGYCQRDFNRGKTKSVHPFQRYSLQCKMFIYLIVTSVNFPQRNKIVCWPRSPGDHALNLEQFPIEGFNATAEDFDKTISELIEFEQSIQVQISNGVHLLILFQKEEVPADDNEDEEDDGLHNLLTEIEGLEEELTELEIELTATE